MEKGGYTADSDLPLLLRLSLQGILKILKRNWQRVACNPSKGIITAQNIIREY